MKSDGERTDRQLMSLQQQRPETSTFPLTHSYSHIPHLVHSTFPFTHSQCNYTVGDYVLIMATLCVCQLSLVSRKETESITQLLGHSEQEGSRKGSGITQR